MHSFPDIPITPASKAFIDAVPLAVVLWEKPPLSTTTSDPQHSLDEAPTFSFLTNVDAWAGAQELKDFRPLIIG